MSLENNVGAALLEAAQRHGTETAISVGDGNLTFAGLGRLILGMAALMRRHGVRQGSCVAIRIEDPRGVIAAIGATSLLGAAWTDGRQQSMSIVARHATHVLIQAGQTSSDLRASAIVVTFDPGKLNLVEVTEPQPYQGFEHGSHMSRIGISSGSTGQAKAIWISSDSEWNRATRTFGALKNIQKLACLCLFPAKSGVGAHTRIFTLLSGGTVIEQLTPQLAAAGIINFVVGSPAPCVQLMHMLNQMGTAGKIPLALVGGARPGTEFMNNMRMKFERIGVFYGSTEMGIIAEFPDAADESYDGRLKPSPEMDIEIVDDANVPVSSGTVGQIRMKTSLGMPSYFDSKANAKAFRDGWYYSGDMGFMSPEGYLYIEGRNDDRANLGGVKVDMLLYDDFLHNFPGIEDGYCFTKPDQMGVDGLHIIARFKAGTNARETASRLMKRIVSSKKLPAIPRSVYASSDVPRTETGKPKKREAVEISQKLQPILVTQKNPTNKGQS